MSEAKRMTIAASQSGITLPDRELACAPFNAPEGRDYFAAMKCGLNMSFANRQVILHRIREAVGKAGGAVDTETIMGRFKEVGGQTEGKIDAGRLRQWIGTYAWSLDES